jgi:CRP-like cAMP-binding protein
MVDVDLTRLFQRIDRRRRLAEHERALLSGGVDATSSYRAKRDVVLEGSRPHQSTLLLTGLAIRYTMLSDGKRQITAIHVPGDFVDLHSYPLEIMDHSVAALTDATFATFPHSALDSIMQQQPALAKTLWMLTLLDSAIHREWLVAMGGLAAPARTAHLFCELYIRLETVGLTSSEGYDFPINQGDLADVLGLSPVHMNRTLQELRAERLIEFQQGRVSILDRKRLEAVAQFDPRYLHLRDDPSMAR